MLINATTANLLPVDYLAFLRTANGGEGFIGETYVQLWRAEESIEFNRMYQTAGLAPPLFLFGSNGGGEAYVFDQSSPGSAVYSVPFIGFEHEYMEEIADSFASLLKLASL